MKIRIANTHEITDADITKVSLVKRGANRAPFKIMKSADSRVRVVKAEERVVRPAPHSLDSMISDAHARKNARR